MPFVLPFATFCARKEGGSSYLSFRRNYNSVALSRDAGCAWQSSQSQVLYAWVLPTRRRYTRNSALIQAIRTAVEK